MSNTKHPDCVPGYNGSIKQLANEIGNMSYDKVALFLLELSGDIKAQSVADLGRGRKKLSEKLSNVSKSLAEAKIEMDEAWKICEPYM